MTMVLDQEGNWQLEDGSSGRKPNGQWLPGVTGLVATNHTKIAQRKALRERCREMGFDWLIECIGRFRDASLPEASRDYALGLIVDRLEPKLKAIEIRSDNIPSQVMINILAGNDRQTETTLIESDTTSHDDE